MAGLNVEQFKKALSNTFVRWSGKVSDAAELIGKINKRIALLDKQIECATPEGEKKFKAEQEQEKKRRESLRQAMVNATQSLYNELAMLGPLEKPNPNDSKKLKAYADDLAEKEGIELAKLGIVVKVDFDFDSKEGKFEKGGIEIKVKW
jgi:hypothetical protein